MSKKLTQQEFISRALSLHGPRYDYTRMTYVNSNSKLEIVCTTHGSFWQTPSNHLMGKGCLMCGRAISKRKSLENDQFLIRVKAIHGDRYEYPEKYSQYHAKLNIICKTHGSFSQTPAHHLVGQGCPKCAGVGRKTATEFIEQSKTTHGNRYDYRLTIYKNSTTPVTIECRQHGVFEQLPREHLKGANCPKCMGRNRTTEEFINEARKQHGNRYDYRNSSYTGVDSKIEIICHKHGSFNQVAYAHMTGSGCPKCSKNISRAETQWLDSLGISEEKRHKQIRVSGYKRPLVVDAFDPDINTVYEFYGDLWHGNPRIFDQNAVHRVAGSKGTYGDLYRRTLERENRIRAAGYDLVTIWEDQWNIQRLM